MKKTKLLLTSLLLFSSALLVTSCDQTPTSSVANVDKITVTVPTDDVIVGDVLNLEDYVTFTNNGVVVNANFDAVLTTPQTATLEGHTLTIIAEGNVNVRISVGEESARFNVDTISGLKSQLKQFVNTAGKRYYVDNVLVENSTYTLSNRGFVHNENYFAYCMDPNLFDDISEVSWEGLIKNFYGSTYYFTMDDIDGTNFEVLPGKQQDLSMYSFNQEFPLDYNNFSTIDNYLITENTTAADNWIVSALGIINTPGDFGYDQYGLKVEWKDVKTSSNETMEALIVTTYVYGFDNYTKNNPYTYTQNAVILNQDYYNLVFANQYIGSRQSPTPIKCDEVQAKFQTYADTKTYTMSTSFHYTDYEGNLLEEDPGAGLPIMTVDSYVNSEGWLCEYSDGQKAGIIGKNDKLYQVSNIEIISDDEFNILNTLEAEELNNSNNEYGSTDVWAKNFGLSHYLVSSLADSSLYSTINVLDKVEDTNSTTYEIGLVDSDSFYLYCFAITPGYGLSLYEVFTDTTYGTALLLFTTIYVTVSQDSIMFDIVLDIGGNTLYHISNQFFDMGVDKLTDKIASVNFN